MIDTERWDATLADLDGPPEGIDDIRPGDVRSGPTPEASDDPRGGTPAE